jgi:hypothetical protein
MSERLPIRDSVQSAAYNELLREVARAARNTPVSTLRKLSLSRNDAYLLRHETQDRFGWDRLHRVALALGVPIAPIWQKYQSAPSDRRAA